MKLYVEGGGETSALRTACREGFSLFITKAGVTRRPRIVACGSRRDAYESFCIASRSGEEAMLLVDSEMLVPDVAQQGPQGQWKPWLHLGERDGDGWSAPPGTSDKDCHLMVQIMESWFLADEDVLKKFFGQGFHQRALPSILNGIEAISKQQVYSALNQATRNCRTKSPYGKGEHSFKLLALVAVEKVIDASPWARRFVDTLKEKLN